MSHTQLLWLVGNIGSISIAGVVTAEHGLSAGLAVGFALMVLVDIRREVRRKGGS